VDARWAATKLATDAGGCRQINRAGHRMMCLIFWPGDVQFTNPQNTGHPSQDVEAARKHIAGQIHHDRQRPGRLRRCRRPRALPRPPVLHRRHPGRLQLRHPQRPHRGRQRTRGDAVAHHRNSRALRAQTVNQQSSAYDGIPLRRVGVTASAGPLPHHHQVRLRLRGQISAECRMNVKAGWCPQRWCFSAGEVRSASCRVDPRPARWRCGRCSPATR
jgi:hypothetical protein